MIYKVLLIGVITTLCRSAVLQKYEPVEAVLKEEGLEEHKFPPIPYNFEFDTRDENGTTLFRRESKDGSGKVEGRYGYKDMFGIERIVEYVADENGYRAKIKTNEPGIDKKNSAGVEFYAGAFTSGSSQEAKKYFNAKPEEGSYIAEKEKKKQVEEKIDSAVAKQYSGIITQPSSLNSQHYLFPEKRDQFLRNNQNSATEIRDENKVIPQEFHYTQSVPTISGNRQHLAIINGQVAAIQYAVPQFQTQGVNIHRRLITVPLAHYN
ncbi:uncharacterized protein NPIL_143331 [Nephila pilipes]|uniref:Cuticular protein n=1 Tax=Nephila pilipes TaxID=299642 RepID=A0A8X6Q0J3_NEPPI|nr:uncharacterized protein NPIL_143331 [Nephila pilipes]